MRNEGLPDLSKCQSWAEHTPNDDALSTYDQAMNFILSRDWCLSIRETYVGIFNPGLVSVFLFRVNSARQDLPEWAWVVVGNLPHLCMTVANRRNPAQALASYIDQLDVWSQAALNSQTIEGMPSDVVPATPEWGESINHTVSYLKRILADYAHDLN